MSSSAQGDSPSRGLPPELRRSVLSQAGSASSPTRQQRRRALWGGHALAALVIVASVMLPGGLGGLTGPDGELRLWPPLLSGAIALVATLALLFPETELSKRGRPSVWVAAALTVASLLLAPWLTADTWSWPSLRDFEQALTAPCLMGYAVFATLALLTSWRGLRRTDLTRSRETGMAMGALVGAWAALVLSLRCPDHDLWHLLLTHALPVLLLMLVSGWLRQRIMANRFDL